MQNQKKINCLAREVFEEFELEFYDCLDPETLNSPERGTIVKLANDFLDNYHEHLMPAVRGKVLDRIEEQYGLCL